MHLVEYVSRQKPTLKGGRIRQMHYYNDFTKNVLDLKDVIIHDVKHENAQIIV